MFQNQHRRAFLKSWLIVGVGLLYLYYHVSFLFDVWWLMRAMMSFHLDNWNVSFRILWSQKNTRCSKKLLLWFIISQVPSGRPPSTSKTRHRLDVRWKRCTFLVVRGKIARNRNTPEHKTKDVIVLLAHTILCTSHLLCICYPHSFSKRKPTSLKISFTTYMFWNSFEK